MEFADLAPLLDMARRDLMSRRITVNPDHWQACLSDELVGLVQGGKQEQARETLMAHLLDNAECCGQDGTCRRWEELAAARSSSTE